MSGLCLLGGCGSYLNGSLGGLFTSSIQFLFTAQCLVNENWPSDASNTVTNLEFDFIIVGAGSAGSVLAGRLSEDSSKRVLVVEAGGDPPFQSMVPSEFQRLISTEYDWHYITQNEQNACRSFNGQCYVPAGKMLGGGSSSHGMYYVRGNRKDYDDLEAAGNTGWNYETALKYFMKSENMSDAYFESDPIARKYHNYSGPLGVTTYKDVSKFEKLVIRGYNEAGYGYNVDYNGEKQTGISITQSTIKEGKRESTARAYLVPARDRPNLIVMKFALVTKILVNNNLATGVRIQLNNGTVVEATATREVIVSAGAIETPHILLLSGIGPKTHLNEFNIPVVADLAVGKNLIDHVFLSIPVNICGPIPLHKDSENPLDVAKYLTERTGFYSNVNTPGYHIHAFINTNGNETVPDIQLIHLTRVNTSLNVCSSNSLDMSMRSGQLNFLVVLLDEESRGTVSLASTNPTDYPIIRANFLSNHTDIRKLLKGIRFVERLIQTRTFASMNAEIVRTDSPACDSFTFHSDEYWRCVLTQRAGNGFHVRGTAKMGPATDPNAVVDPELKVYGVKQLRVADASVMPGAIRGNTNAPTIMFAERAADLIKDAHR